MITNETPPIRPSKFQLVKEETSCMELSRCTILHSELRIAAPQWCLFAYQSGGDTGYQITCLRDNSGVKSTYQSIFQYCIEKSKLQAIFINGKALPTSSELPQIRRGGPTARKGETSGSRLKIVLHPLGPNNRL